MNDLQLALVMVALDGSPFAERALPLACAIARQAGDHGQVELVHVHDMGVASPNAPVVEPRWENERAGEMRVAVERAAARLAAESGLRVTAVMLRGRVAESITRHAIERRADMLVITTHGRTGLKRALIGSVAEQIVRTAKTPVLVVPSSE